MADPIPAPDGFSLKRWSQRKHEAARGAAAEADTASPAPATEVADASAAAPAAPSTSPGAPALPAIESLTPASDYSPFMNPGVDEGVKRAALKKLFTDPQFNVMDGLDIYTGDYTQADPMPEGMLERLGKVYAAVTGPKEEAEPPPDALTPSTPPTTSPSEASAPPEPGVTEPPLVEAPAIDASTVPQAPLSDAPPESLIRPPEPKATPADPTTPVPRQRSPA